MSKTLVIYYSRTGQNYVSGQIVNLPKGNTEICAEYIKEAVKADLFEVKTVKTYAEDYHACTEEAMAELKVQARPELKQYLESIADYDNIVIAGSCWWGTYPMPIFSQLECLDFTGKNVFALMTHEGSGLGHSERDLKSFCKGATIGKGLAVHGSNIQASEATVKTWATKFLGE